MSACLSPWAGGCCPHLPAAVAALLPLNNPSSPSPPPLNQYQSTTQHPPNSDRFLDDFLIALRRKLPTTSAAGLGTIVSALPALSSGVRLNEVVAEARARYDALAAAEQQQQEEAAAAYAAEYPQEGAAAPEAVTA